MSITNATLAQKINDLVEQWETFQDEQQAWMNGTVGGGPNLDGQYPLTDYQDNIVLATCPAQLEDGVVGPVADSEAAQAAAEAAQVAAELAEANAEAAQVLSETAETGSVAAKDLAETAKADAESARTVAIAQAAAALASAADAAADAVLTAADVVTTAADVVSTNADVVLTGLDVGYATEWAIAVEDTLISAAAGGNETTDYSALHWAAKAAADAASIDPALLFTLADDETVTGKTTFAHPGVADYAVKIANQWAADAGHGLWIDTRWDTAANFPLKITTDSEASTLLTLSGTGVMTLTGAMNATSFGGITEANLTDKSDNEIVTGSWGFPVSLSAGLGGSTSAPFSLYGGSSDHLYMQWFADSAAQSSRSFYMGFGAAGTEIFSFAMDQYSSGSFAFNKDVAIAGALTVSYPIQIATSAAPKLQLFEEGEAADEGYWDMLVSSSDFSIRTRTDVDGSGVNGLKIFRGTGTAISNVYIGSAWGQFKSTGLEIQGSSYTTNPTGIKIGQYTSTIGYVQVPGGATGGLAIWKGNTAEIAKFNSTTPHFDVTGDVQADGYIMAKGTIPTLIAGQSALGADFLHLDGKEALDGNDTWLRLNQNLDFANGTYTPGNFYITGNFLFGTTSDGFFSSTDVDVKFPAYRAFNFQSGTAIAQEDGHNIWCESTLGVDDLHHYQNVKGGSYSNDASSVTGYARIEFPDGSHSDNAMLSMVISGYNYSGAYGGWSVLVSGYAYASANWANVDAKIISGNPPFDVVRFGEATSNKYILLGSPGTVWYYPGIVIRDLTINYSSQSDYVTDDEGFTIDINATPPTGWVQANWKYVGGSPNWGQAGMNLGGNLTISTSAASGGNDGDIHFKY